MVRFTGIILSDAVLGIFGVSFSSLRFIQLQISVLWILSTLGLKFYFLSGLGNMSSRLVGMGNIPETFPGQERLRWGVSAAFPVILL